MKKRLICRYTVTHIPTGNFAHGLTGNIPGYLSEIRRLLGKGTFHNKKLQEVFTCQEDIDINIEFFESVQEANRTYLELLEETRNNPLCCNYFKGEYESRPGYYTLTHKISGYFYIGSSKNVRVRLLAHQSMLKKEKHSNSKLQSIYTSWDDFDIVVSYFDCHKEASLKEQLLLNQYYDNPLCCNIAANADGGNWQKGKPITLQHSENISAALRGKKQSAETIEKRASKLRGKKRSAELNVKMGNIHRGKVLSAETRKKIADKLTGKPNPSSWKGVIIDGVKYKSQFEAEEKLGLRRGVVWERINHPKNKWPSWQYDTDK